VPMTTPFPTASFGNLSRALTFPPMGYIGFERTPPAMTQPPYPSARPIMENYSVQVDSVAQAPSTFLSSPTMSFPQQNVYLQNQTSAGSYD